MLSGGITAQNQQEKNTRDRLRGNMQALIHPITLLMIIFIGYAFKKTHIVGEKDYRVLQRIVFNLTLPAAILTSFMSSEHDLILLWISVVGLICGFLPTPILYLFSRKKSVRERTFLMLNGSGFNVGNFGFPVMQSLLGPGSLVAGAMFDIGNCIVVSAGNSLLTQSLLHINPDKPLSEQNETDAPKLPHIRPKDKDARRLARRAAIRRILKVFFTSVPFDCYVLMIILMIANISLPSWVSTVLDPISTGNAFCSMLMVGMLMDFPNNVQEVKQALRVVAWRLPFALLFAAAAWFLLPFDPVTRKAVVMVCFCPTAVFATLFSDRVLGSARMAGFCLSLTSILGIIAFSVVNIVVPA